MAISIYIFCFWKRRSRSGQTSVGRGYKRRAYTHAKAGKQPAQLDDCTQRAQAACPSKRGASTIPNSKQARGSDANGRSTSSGGGFARNNVLTKRGESNIRRDGRRSRTARTLSDDSSHEAFKT